MMKGELLQLNNLSTGYVNAGETKLVGQHMSGVLRQGELVCLLGANGAGKSTLMRSICGFLPVIQGEILINNVRVRNISDKVMARQLAVVLTDKVETENITVEELVAYGRSPYTGFLGRLNNEDRRIVKQSLKQCGVFDKADRQVHSLSDGERQKVMIAKALAQDTSFIMLDEPTAFLDLPTRVDVMQLLRQLASTGKTILMSTHDLDLALQLADKIWLMHADGSFETGTPEDLLIKNSIQRIFNKEKVVFNAKTGLFQVNHQYTQTLAVKGHGFAYVLLRRALSRNGVKTVNLTSNADVYVYIEKEEKPTFSIYAYGEKLNAYTQMEQLIDAILLLLSQQTVVSQPAATT